MDKDMVLSLQTLGEDDQMEANGTILLTTTVTVTVAWSTASNHCSSASLFCRD